MLCITLQSTRSYSTLVWPFRSCLTHLNQLGPNSTIHVMLSSPQSAKSYSTRAWPLRSSITRLNHINLSFNSTMQFNLLCTPCQVLHDLHVSYENNQVFEVHLNSMCHGRTSCIEEGHSVSHIVVHMRKERLWDTT